jgi:hypothetical protein
MEQHENRKINCPNCGEEIDVQDILYHRVDEELKKRYREELRLQEEKFKAQAQELEQQRQNLQDQKEKQDQEIDDKIRQGLKIKEQQLAQKIKAAAEEEQSAALKMLRDELEEKSGKLKELHKTAAELERLKREKDELETSIRAESAREYNQRLAAEREKIQKEEGDKQELKLKELEKQLADQKKLTEEMKRKQEQGSMQTQGEVLELAIEQWLAEQFPLDVIEEIKKGERGADCLQIVNTRRRSNCGSIYYESKRTKHFQPNWIEKFKADIREKNADIGVLVTEVMPPDMDRLGLKEGVWICSYEEFKGLCTVLRESIIRLSSAIVIQENKGDKMGMLYDYLTSNEFRLQIEAIVEGFTQMRADLLSEQRSMRGIWKKREKQIDKVLLNTTDMYGSIKGIAGNAIQPVSLLELPVGDEGDGDDD